MAEPLVAQLLRNHPDDIVAVVYHTPWPGIDDPFYQHNPTQNLARAEYYNVPYVPWFLFDGILYLMDYIPYQLYEDAYDQRKLVPTDVSLVHTGIYHPADGLVDFAVTASAESTLPPGDYRIHIVLTESGLEWEAPNGTNVHNHTMRGMVPSEQGTSVTFTGDFPQTAQAVVNFVLDPL
ncbi:MAG: hypothetical protein AMS18_14110 [Gemmatimonas sp. SG8_17]|nr:MAG: hypothetical protein AMS18_14110 [Gemmatimonas sp. SG8_17]